MHQIQHFRWPLLCVYLNTESAHFFHLQHCTTLYRSSAAAMDRTINPYSKWMCDSPGSFSRPLTTSAKSDGERGKITRVERGLWAVPNAFALTSFCNSKLKNYSDWTSISYHCTVSIYYINSFTRCIGQIKHRKSGLLPQQENMYVAVKKEDGDVISGGVGSRRFSVC